MGIVMMARRHTFLLPLHAFPVRPISHRRQEHLQRYTYILGKSSVGDLKRAFKAVSMQVCFPFTSSPSFLLICSVALAAGTRTDAAAIAEADKKIEKKEK